MLVEDTVRSVIEPVLGIYTMLDSVFIISSFISVSLNPIFIRAINYSCSLCLFISGFLCGLCPQSNHVTIDLQECSDNCYIGLVIFILLCELMF